MPIAFKVKIPARCLYNQITCLLPLVNYLPAAFSLNTCLLPLQSKRNLPAAFTVKTNSFMEMM